MDANNSEDTTATTTATADGAATTAARGCCRSTRRKRSRGREVDAAAAEAESRRLTRASQEGTWQWFETRRPGSGWATGPPVKTKWDIAVSKWGRRWRTTRYEHDKEEEDEEDKEEEEEECVNE